MSTCVFQFSEHLDRNNFEHETHLKLSAFYSIWSKKDFLYDPLKISTILTEEALKKNKKRDNYLWFIDVVYSSFWPKPTSFMRAHRRYAFRFFLQLKKFCR